MAVLRLLERAVYASTDVHTLRTIADRSWLMLLYRNGPPAQVSGSRLAGPLLTAADVAPRDLLARGALVAALQAGERAAGSPGKTSSGPV